jgi:hypothetical protein
LPELGPPAERVQLQSEEAGAPRALTATIKEML